MKKMAFQVIMACLIAGIAVPARATVKNPDTFVFASYGTLRTLDPCVCYDSVSGQRVLNIYEPLIFFDGSATDKFVPC